METFPPYNGEQAMSLLSNAVQSENTYMTTTNMTKEQPEGFEQYMECIHSLDEVLVSRPASRV